MLNKDKTNYVEDYFELNDINRKYKEKKIRSSNAREKRVAAALYFFSVVLALFAAYFGYQEFNYYKELEKNKITNETARRIIMEKSATKDTAQAKAPLKTEKHLLEEIAALRDAFLNDDIVGYLQIEGTGIDNVVVQTSDNDFYLDKDLYKETNGAGSVFMDYECNPYELRKNTVIYGHNIRDGSMFHDIKNYEDENYYNDHKFIRFTTPYGSTTWEIFSFYKTQTDFYYIQVLFRDDAEFLELISLMKEKALYDTGVLVDSSDQILTLSTCSNTSNNTRYVINARFVKE